MSARAIDPLNLSIERSLRTIEDVVRRYDERTHYYAPPVEADWPRRWDERDANAAGQPMYGEL